ncbi:MAG TPA: PH domain-containing protein [Candidatus Acidoferrales bacterium]|nr:PH domain-containing protein [Candidatus Acidoferrales bacterium]
MADDARWTGSPSWWTYFGRVGGAILLAAGAGALQASSWEYKTAAALFVLLCAALLFVSVCWSKFSNRFCVSRAAVSATYGLLSQETHEIDVRDIKDIVLKQSLAGRIFDYGTLEFSSAGRDTAEVVFENVPAVKAVKDLVTELKRNETASRL